MFTLARAHLTYFILCITSLYLFACAPTSTPAKPSNITVIKNATILTMNAERDVIDKGVIVIEGSDITAIGAATLAADHPNAHHIDAQGAIVMPGMINLHNHLSMIAFRGIAESGITDFQDRLENYFFPLEAELLDRKLIHVSARHAAIEMALAGVTTTADMYYHEDEVAKAVKSVGMRGVLGETVIGFPVVDAPEPYGGLAYGEQFIKDWQDDPLITPALAPHAPYTMSPEKLRETKALSDQYNAPILIHMDEIGHEEALTAERFPDSTQNRTVVEYLDDLEFLGPNVIAAHVNHVTPSDIATLKARGVGVAHNPKANTKDMSGLAPAWDMYKAGLAIGLGTDGPMSSNQMDIINVMPYAVRIARIRDTNIARFDPVEVVAMATINGARALNMEDEIGSLEVGKKADLILIETQSPNMQPNYNPYATIVLSAYPSNVILTMVDGKIIAHDGKPTNIDMDAHRKDWGQIQQKVSDFLKSRSAP